MPTTAAYDEFDRYIDSLGRDGRVSRAQKLTEDAMSAVGALADVLAEEGLALHCVLHGGRQAMRCPVCALEATRQSNGLRPPGRVFASGR
jgi:hypothetical protein